MATNKPITHVFSEINEGKYKSVKHYGLIKVSNGTARLTELINISKDRNCAYSMPDYWLKEMNSNKWSTHCTTGLFKTGASLIYKGDTEKRKNLLLFKFSDNAKTLTVYYYPNYYTKDLSNLLPTITD